MLGPRSAHESMARFLFTDTSIAEEGDRLKMFMKDSVYVLYRHVIPQEI